MIGKGKEIIIALVLGVFLPMIVFASVSEKSEIQDNSISTEKQTEIPIESESVSAEPVYLPIRMEDGSIQSMEMESYITAVVLAEMPADFEKEALKAQAVVARTFALRGLKENYKHIGAAVCTEYACCQGYLPVSEYRKNGGSEESVVKVQRAVTETAGQVLTYNGGLIQATYFSCSGGMTEDAQAVWGGDVPYLQAVESPGEESAKYYTDSVTFTKEEFQKLLGEILTENPEEWLEAVSYTSGGGVDTIRLCGKEFKGTTMRQKLGLRSTAFVLTATKSAVTITTRGFGHRVGMSQYGADAMAAQGKNYQEILSHYYQDTQLTDYPS